MVKKDNIQPYDGSDAYYEGTDKDYEDFLKSIDGNINGGADVDDDKRIDLSETINLKNVFDIVKRKAGELGTAAKKVTDDVVEQIKTASETKKSGAGDTDIDMPDAENTEGAEDNAADNAEERVPITAQISETAKAAKEHFSTADIKGKIEDITAMSNNVKEISKKLSELIEKTDDLTAKQNEIENKQVEGKNNLDRSVNDLRSELGKLGTDLAEVKQNINLLAKLNDSIFDLKNAQQNNKNALEEIKDAQNAAKKKMVAGITVISILSAIVIILQIINLLA